MGTPSRRLGSWTAYGGALATVAVVTGLISLLPGVSHIANASMLYLLAVIASALLFGSGPAVLASIAAFFAFDWFFVAPRHTFTVSDPAEWLALVTFLVTAGTTGQLTALLRDRAEEARTRERETAALAEASWAVASQVEAEKALGEVLRRVADVIPAKSLQLVSPAGARVASWGEAGRPSHPEVVRFVAESRRPVFWTGPRQHWEKALAHLGEPGAIYLPLLIEARVVGVLHAEVDPQRAIAPQEQRVVESLANHAAVVLERERLATAEAHAQALQEADRLKTALLSMVSHDFRSPLTGIKAGVTTLLQEGAPMPAETNRELLLGIDRETDRLNRMVGNILALSRLEADAWRPQREPTPVAELIGPALATFSSADNARVRVEVEPGFPDLDVDPVQMVQVVRNLAENALKYSPMDQPVEIRSYRDGEEAVLSVLDHGPGLQPGSEEKIWEPFYRAPGLEETALPGAGIGLAVCRGLVEAHDGRLLAHNREGGGACFTLRLPLNEGSRDARAGGR
jgi:two-component system sensor histidine kinase KdpD